MLQRIYYCRFCGREMKRNPENQFCNTCLLTRLEEAASRVGPRRWVERDGYMVSIPIVDDPF